MTCTGQGWSQIDTEWDIPRLEAWNRYSRSHPPTHLMIAAYLGVKPEAKPSTAESLVSQLLTIGS